MEVSIVLDVRSEAWRIAEWGKLAEKYNIKGVWLSSLMNAKDPFLNLSLLARDTRRIRLGPIAISPYEIHPIRIAMSILTLHEISSGRARIVIGGGGTITKSIGVNLADHKRIRRIRTVRECVEIVKRASRGEEVNFEGEIFKVYGFKAKWTPKEELPVYIAANEPKMLRMSCRVADGVMVTDIPPQYIRKMVERIREEVKNAGRNLTEFKIINFYAWHVKKDYNEALNEAKMYLPVRGVERPYIAQTIGLTQEEFEVYLKNHERLMKLMREEKPPEGVPEGILDKIAEGVTIVGQVDRLDKCLEKLYRFKREGVDEVALRIYGDPADSIKLIGEKVIPYLQSL